MTAEEKLKRLKPRTCRSCWYWCDIRGCHNSNAKPIKVGSCHNRRPLVNPHHLPYGKGTEIGHHGR